MPVADAVSRETSRESVCGRGAVAESWIIVPPRVAKKAVR